MSDIAKTETPELFVNRYSIDRRAHFYKVPKMLRDTFSSVFKSAKYRDDCTVAIYASGENLAEWSKEIGIRPSAVEKRIERLVDEGFLFHDVLNGVVLNDVYVVAQDLYVFQDKYEPTLCDGTLRVRESASDKWTNCRFPKFINALSWYEGFNDMTRRVFVYAMGNVTETSYGDFLNTDGEFTSSASKWCHVSVEDVENAVSSLHSRELITETRKGVYFLNPSKFVDGVSWSSIIEIDADFQFNRMGRSMSIRYIENTPQAL